MRKALFLSIFALCNSPALSAAPAQCDATAFTLKKPAQTAPKAEKPAAKPVLARPEPKKAKSKKKTTTRLISDCKDEKKGG